MATIFYVQFQSGYDRLDKVVYNCDIRSVGHSLADTIGLPGGGNLPL